MIMIIGSNAIKAHFPDFKREPKDLDVITDAKPEYIKDVFSNWDHVDIFWDDRMAGLFGSGVATPDELYTLKISHAFWDINKTWEKHMSDILFLQKKGAQFDRALYDALLPIWKEQHGKKRTSLAKNKMDFFGDAVVRKYDHDSLHDSVAYGDEPMYTRILKDGSEVMVDNSKFWAMSLEDKYKTIREEVYATALERWVVPTNYTISPRLAYSYAMKKSLTSLFKGEWALFIALNYSDLWQPDMNYVARHKSQSHKLILL
jgi:hypothetical protein